MNSLSLTVIEHAPAYQRFCRRYGFRGNSRQFFQDPLLPRLLTVYLLAEIHRLEEQLKNSSLDYAEVHSIKSKRSH